MWGMEKVSEKCTYRGFEDASLFEFDFQMKW